MLAGGWFVLKEKYCWLVADKPSEQGERPEKRKGDEVQATAAGLSCFAVQGDELGGSGGLEDECNKVSLRVSAAGTKRRGAQPHPCR
jgi:hypothetical protein